MNGAISTSRMISAGAAMCPVISQGAGALAGPVCFGRDVTALPAVPTALALPSGSTTAALALPSGSTTTALALPSGSTTAVSLWNAPAILKDRLVEYTTAATRYLLPAASSVLPTLASYVLPSALILPTLYLAHRYLVNREVSKVEHQHRDTLQQIHQSMAKQVGQQQEENQQVIDGLQKEVAELKKQKRRLQKSKVNQKSPPPTAARPATGAAQGGSAYGSYPASPVYGYGYYSYPLFVPVRCYPVMAMPVIPMYPVMPWSAGYAVGAFGGWGYYGLA